LARKAASASEWRSGSCRPAIPRVALHALSVGFRNLVHMISMARNRVKLSALSIAITCGINFADASRAEGFLSTRGHWGPRHENCLLAPSIPGTLRPPRYLSSPRALHNGTKSCTTSAQVSLTKAVSFGGTQRPRYRRDQRGISAVPEICPSLQLRSSRNSFVYAAWVKPSCPIPCSVKVAPQANDHVCPVLLTTPSSW
jgi:hypothetical protein